MTVVKKESVWGGGGVLNKERTLFVSDHCFNTVLLIHWKVGSRNSLRQTESQCWRLRRKDFGKKRRVRVESPKEGGDELTFMNRNRLSVISLLVSKCDAE